MIQQQQSETVVVPDPKDFEAAFASMVAQHSPPDEEYWLAYFVGGPDESGDSWCPDCTKAKPAIHASLEKSAKSRPLSVMKCVVPTRFE